jgi:hypothetical protein
MARDYSVYIYIFVGLCLTTDWDWEARFPDPTAGTNRRWLSWLRFRFRLAFDIHSAPFHSVQVSTDRIEISCCHCHRLVPPAAHSLALHTISVLCVHSKFSSNSCFQNLRSLHQEIHQRKCTKFTHTEQPSEVATDQACTYHKSKNRTNSS